MKPESQIIYNISSINLCVTVNNKCPFNYNYSYFTNLSNCLPQLISGFTLPFFKGTPWDEIFNFENLIYMKLYSLLILTKKTKKSKNNFKAPKKSEIVIFSGRILPCKQNKSAIYSTLHHIFPRLGR